MTAGWLLSTVCDSRRSYTQNTQVQKDKLALTKVEWAFLYMSVVHIQTSPRAVIKKQLSQQKPWKWIVGHGQVHASNIRACRRTRIQTQGKCLSMDLEDWKNSSVWNSLTGNVKLYHCKPMLQLDIFSGFHLSYKTELSAKKLWEHTSTLKHF